MAIKKTIPAINNSTANTSTVVSVSNATNVATSAPILPNGVYPTAGFGQFDLKDCTFTDPSTRKTTVIPDDYREAITDVIYEKNMAGVSTVTLQLQDPNRTLIKNLVKQGTEITINDNGQKITFSFSQFTKTSDQIQMVFESNTVYRLHNQRNPTGTVTTYTSTGVTEFMASLVYALNYSGSPYPPVKFVGPDYATIWSQLTGNTGKAVVSVGLGRGTTTDPFEDSWTCMSRIASSVGWRLWENNGTVYFGPDEYWLGLLTESGGLAVPPINKLMGTTGNKIPKLMEFQPDTLYIDYDWDVQKPFGQATVTDMLENWQYDIGEVVEIKGLGLADGYWFVYDMQRDFFMPQATMILQVPMPFASVYDPTSLPLPGLPLTAKLA